MISQRDVASFIGAAKLIAPREEGDSFASVRGVAGGAILGDGRIGLILDPHGIVTMVREGSRRAA